MGYVMQAGQRMSPHICRPIGSCYGQGKQERARLWGAGA